jgi:hypothetical protein
MFFIGQSLPRFSSASCTREMTISEIDIRHLVWLNARFFAVVQSAHVMRPRVTRTTEPRDPS